MKRLFVLAVLASLPAAAFAQGTALHARTAGELAELCSQSGKDPAGAAKLNFCLGYAQATFDAEARHAGGKRPFCLPNPAPTRTATMGEFASWVRSSGSTGTPSQEALMRFMGQKFPCK
ncbi:MAG: Rap1a/Tai family immunity protein [Acetobacteraceae bacterium]